MQQLYYLDREVAEKELKAKLGVPIGFCPLANIQCNSRCVCYCDARIQQGVKDLDTVWYLYDSYCNNHMFWGE